MDMHNEIIADSASGARSLTDFRRLIVLFRLTQGQSGGLGDFLRDRQLATRKTRPFFQIDHHRES
jgi:hypothetical protein